MGALETNITTANAKPVLVESMAAYLCGKIGNKLFVQVHVRG